MTLLHLDLRVGETLAFGNGAVRVTLEKKSGQIARLRIVADEATRISPPHRENTLAHECDSHMEK